MSGEAQQEIALLSPLLATILLTGATGDTPPDSTVSRLVERFFAADTVSRSQKQAARIVTLAPGFASIYDRMGGGRGYSANVKRGIVERSRRNRDGTRHRYLVVVPEDYDPGRRYPVRVYLHGGIARPAWGGGGKWWRDPKRLLRDDRIAIVPASWSGSKWWQASQVENVTAILREVKRTYNVDENRVCLIGISDGGTGAWFFAFRSATEWASFSSFIGSPFVLVNPRGGADGALFTSNLHGTALLVINGSQDPLYPAEPQRSFMELVRKIGADITFEVVEGGGHNVRWWPERAARIDAFIESHERDPLPDRVLWASERTDHYNRAHWVVVDELGPDGNSEGPELAVFGPAPESFGGLDVRRQGNTVDVRTRGVQSYRLLLSPEEFDLDAEIVVTTNGQESFRGVVPRSLATLLHWAARDMDRTMLFAAELSIEVPPFAPRESGDAPTGLDRPVE
jgi:predicted esterase